MQCSDRYLVFRYSRFNSYGRILVLESVTYLIFILFFGGRLCSFSRLSSLLVGLLVLIFLSAIGVFIIITLSNAFFGGL